MLLLLTREYKRECLALECVGVVTQCRVGIGFTISVREPSHDCALCDRVVTEGSTALAGKVDIA